MEDPATLLKDTREGLNFADDTRSLRKIVEAEAEIARIRTERVHDAHTILRSLSRQVSAFRDQVERESADLKSRNQSEALDALAEQNESLERDISAAEADIEGLEESLRQVQAEIAGLEEAPIECGASTSTVLRLKLYRDLGLELEESADGVRAVVAVSGKGRAVRIPVGGSSVEQCGKIWSVLAE